jgi:dimeric dUTPase (all-alpha-NTP-PPase superfamily)
MQSTSIVSLHQTSWLANIESTHAILNLVLYLNFNSKLPTNDYEWIMNEQFRMVLCNILYHTCITAALMTCIPYMY